MEHLSSNVYLSVDLTVVEVDGQKRFFIGQTDFTDALVVDGTVSAEIVVEASGKWDPGTKGGYSKSHGNFLPGDPSELTDVEALVGDKDVFDDLPEADQKEVEKKLMEMLDHGD